MSTNTETTNATAIKSIAESLAGASQAQDMLLGKIAAAANGLIAYFGIAGKGHSKENPYHPTKKDWVTMREGVSARYLELAEASAASAGREYIKSVAQGRFRAELKRAAAQAFIMNPDALDQTTETTAKPKPKAKPGAKHKKLHRCPGCKAMLVMSKGALVAAPGWPTAKPKAKAKAKAKPKAVE